MAINTAPDIHKMVICANVFVKHSGTYLLLKRSPLKKYLPNYVHPVGGKIDIDEDPFEGAQRELWEEAGIRIKNMRIEAIVTEIRPIKGENENWLIFHFSGEYESGEIKTTEEGELLWFTKDEIKRQLLFPSIRYTIDYILDDQTGLVFATFIYDEEGQAQVKALHVCER